MRFRLPFLMVLGLCAAAPARTEILEATNGILTILIAGPEDPSPGLFTVRTGAAHPDPDRDVLYGCDPGPCPDPTFTGYISLLDSTSSQIWVNADNRGLQGWPGFIRETMSGHPVSFSSLGTQGFRVSYMLPDVAVSQDVFIQGETLENTSVRHTVTLTNISSSPRQLGLRYLWDWRIGSRDDAYFRPRDPDGDFEQEFRTFYLPQFLRYEAADSLVVALVKVFGTVREGSLLTPPTEPEELRFAPWDSAQEFPWLFDMPEDPENYDDSAIVYYWGSGTPFEVEPLGSRVFTQYVTTNIEALRRSVPVIGKTASPTGRVCPNDVLTYRISFANIGDGTTRNLTITDSEAVWVEFVPDSLEFFAEPDHSGYPSLISRAWAPTAGGPWVSGDPPAGQSPPLNFRWVVDRVSPGRSGFIEFEARVLDSVPWNSRLKNYASATNMLDATVFKGDEVENIYGAMELVKTALPGEVLVGEEFNYQIVYYNDYCAAPVRDVRIWDTLPPGVEFLSATAGGVFDGTKLDWSIGDLEPHTAGGVQVYLRATSTGFNIPANCAYLDYRSEKGDTMPRVAACSGGVTVNQPRIIFRKFVGVQGEETMVARDGVLDYAIDVINQYDATVTNLVIWDTPPYDVSYIEGACTAGCTWDGEKLVWNMPPLPPKDDVQVFFSVRVSSTECNTCCYNFASMRYSLDGGLSSTHLDTNLISASLFNPYIQVLKSASDWQVTPGETFQYTAVIANSGAATACNLTAWDPFTDGFEYLGCDGPPGSSCFSDGEGVRWLDLPAVEPDGFYTVTMEGAAITREMALPFNRLSVDFDNCLECGPWEQISPGVEVTVRQPLLEMVPGRSSAVVSPGETISFTLSLTNTGSDSALNITVLDSLPSGVDFSSCGAPSGWGCSFDGERVIWELSTETGLLPSESALLSYSAMVVSTGPPIPKRDACAAYENRLGMAMPGFCTEFKEVAVEDAYLSIQKFADQAEVGENSVFRYWISVTNNGGVAATNVKLWDTLPAGAEFVGCSGTCLYDGEKVSWTLFPDVGAGETKTAYINVLAARDMGCSNYAQADYSNGVPTPRPRVTSNSACVRVVQPVMVVQLAANRDIVRSGQTLSYAILATNTGTGRAQKATLWATLPVGSILSSCTPTCSLHYTGTIVFWSLGSIDPGASEAMSFTVLPATPDCAGVTLLSEARLTFENTGAVPLEAEAFASPVMAIRSEIPLTLTPSAWTVRQGELLAYTLGYSNPCSDTAYEVVIWDSVPADTQFVRCDPPCVRDGEMVIWTLSPEVGPGATGALSFTVTVTGTGPLIGPVVALGDYEDSLGSSLPRTMSNPVTVSIASPKLEVEKSGPATAVTQDGVAFGLRVRNVGADTAFNVVLVDTLPAPLGPPPSGGSVTVEGQIVTWHAGDLDPGQESFLELKAAGPELEIEQRILNRVHARYETYSGMSLDGPWAVHEMLLTPRLLFAVYPNPFSPKTAVRGTLKFTGLPPGSRVGIYTLTGVLIREYQVAHVGRVEWDGRNAQGAEVAAGVYLWAVEFPESFAGERWRKGKVGLIR